MFTYEKLELPKLGRRGLEAGLSEEETAIQDGVHRFASEVMRPIGRELDKMTPEQAVAEGSPLFDYLSEFQKAGIMDLGAMAEMDNAQKARIFPLIFEELGWGDSGLAICSLATAIPAFSALTTGDSEIIEQFGSVPGCWLGTHPDRGSDVVDMNAEVAYPGSRQSKGNIWAKKVGDEYIINGQSSSWVSFGPLAQTTMAFMPCDYGDGMEIPNSAAFHNVGILIPLDLPGISRGKPLDKIGQRPLPQGEIFFDNVKVPARFAIYEKEKALLQFLATLTFANMEMAATFTGVARSAFELGLSYVHERKQGGVPIIQHQSVQARTFSLWQRVEACRAMTQRVFDFNYSDNGPALMASVTSKTYVTDTAFEVASDALQLFGGNGLTRDYPIEKIMRDARASMIEDGENNVLNLKAMASLSQWYQATSGS